MKRFEKEKQTIINQKTRRVKMKTLKRLIASSMAVLLAAGMTLNFSGCSKESTMGPTVDTDQQADFQILAKKSKITSSTLEGSSTSNVEQGSATPRYFKKWDAYNGGKIILSQGSQFEWLYGALTPPADLYGQDVTLTMTVIKEANNKLLFEFGPSGSSFEPAATVWFHYAGSDPKLYYINDDGSYVEQQPDEVDTQNQWLMLKINHFSRYAVAWAN